MGKVGGIARATGFLLIIGAVAIGATAFREQLGISTGTWLLCLGILAFLHVSISTLKDRIGIDEVPTFKRLLAKEHREPIEPRHESSEGIPKDGWAVDEELHEFYGHFAKFADVINEDLKETAWRLQEAADSEVGSMDDDGPVYGRRYRLFHGQHEAGEVTLTNGYDYSALAPKTYVRVKVLE